MRCIYIAALIFSLAIGAKAQDCLPSPDCVDAPLFCGFVLETSVFVNDQPPLYPVMPSIACNIIPHNSNWFRIVPCSATLDITIMVLTSTNFNGLQAALYNDCSQSFIYACNPGLDFGSVLPLHIVATVEPGTEYTLVVDGFDDDICTYYFQINEGLDVSPPPPSIEPVGGAISGPTGGLCNGWGGSIAPYFAAWPGCDAFEEGPLSCFEPPEDSCRGIKWTLPPGANVIGDPFANPIIIDWSHVVAGTYTIKAKPMDCGCPQGLCVDCGQACCPVEELSLSITISGTCNHNCTNFNYPAPPGDDCALAPFFCGNFLDGYCSSNAGLDNDTLAGNILRNSGFLRLAPCSGSDSLLLRLRVRDCTQGIGLVFHLVSDACGTPEFISSIVVPNGVTTNFFVDNLIPEATYYLVFEGGPTAGVCELFIEVIAGIGTATPGVSADETTVCDCTNATIGGPDALCPGDIAEFFIASPGFCNVTTVPGSSPFPGPGSHLGNGYYCCPESEDSLRIVWHIPSAMNFLSDSVGVSTITVQVDSSLLGIDTLIMDSVWFSFEPIPNPLDTLVFCNSCAGCAPGVDPKPVTIRHDVEYHFCFLDCYDPLCQVGNMVYFQEGTYTDTTNCLTQIVQVFDNNDPPFGVIMPAQPVLTCENPTLTLTATPFSSNIPALEFSWTGPGIISPSNAQSVVVNQPGSYACTITNVQNGCVAVVNNVVLLDMTEPLAVAGPDLSICIGQSISLSPTGSSSGGPYTYAWSGGMYVLSGPNPVVSPPVTTQYTLTVINNSNGCAGEDDVIVVVVPPDTLELGVVGTISCLQPCVTYSGTDYCIPGTYLIQSSLCEISRFLIVEDPDLLTVTLPPVTLCEGECFDFYGQQYCASTTVSQEDNCTIFVQQIIVNAPDTLELGVVGTISCLAPCFSYQGVDYCLPGEYALSATCMVTRFEIAFTRDTLELGEIGALSCQQSCVSFMEELYCAPGNFITEDDCTVYHFSIGENQDPPDYSNPVMNCLPDNQQYTVGFVISGTPPYKVNGETIPGAYYLSTPIMNGEPYAFVIEQVSNGCQTLLNGAHDCSFMCTGNPGTMESSTLHVCIGEEAVVLPLSPPQPTTGQGVHYILHTSSGAAPGTILAENIEGVFSFDATTMVPEAVYYVSCAIGVVNSTGALDFNNLCTRIGPGQPLVFHAMPGFGEVITIDPSCFGAADGSLNILLAEGAAPHAFALGSGPFGNSALFENLPAGSYGLVLRDAYGCQADTAFTLTEPDSLWLSLGPDREIIRGETVLLQAESNIVTPILNWSNTQNVETHEGADWLVQPSTNTLYNCVAQDEKGCAANAAVLLKVKSGSIYHPNVLNRSSQEPANRAFTLFAREGYVQQINSLKIFDRWGALAFQRNFFAPNLPELGWDGSIGGKPVNAGVFVFVAEVLLFDGTIELVKGDVTVF